MDCGPAALMALLNGHGLPAAYGRLREACQTEVDGTSIDTLEDVANRLGLDAEQILLPPDAVLQEESEALPCLAVTTLLGGLTHFVVIWRVHGPFVQVMDPAVGRRWIRSDRLLGDLYSHSMRIPAATYLEWTAAEGFRAALRSRLAGLAGPAEADDLVADAARRGSWLPWAALAAAARLASILGSRPRPGLLVRLYQSGLVAAGPCPDLPAAHWAAIPSPQGPDGGEMVEVRGAVLLTVRGRSNADLASLPASLRAVLAEPPARPGRLLAGLILAGGRTWPALLGLGLLLSAAGTLGEALLFRSLLDRLPVLPALIALGVGLSLLDLSLVAATLRAGRSLERSLREALLERIPRLPDRYLRSRPTSDMAERSHNLHQVATLPPLAADLLRTAFELLLVAIGIAYLAPGAAIPAGIAAAAAAAIPLAFQPLLGERDLRLRSHTGAMARFYLDALLGLVAIRAHAGAEAVRREHEVMLGSWTGSALAATRAGVAAEVVQTVAGFGLAFWIVAAYSGPGDPGARLLLIYWALALPVLGQHLGLLGRQYPIHRSLVLRLLEPLGAEVDPDPDPDAIAPIATSGPAAIEFQSLGVEAAGRPVIEAVTLAIAPGEHVAVVGRSGAGKSTLAGLLLGWERPATGRLLIDGREPSATDLAGLRAATAWVDSTVRIWNRTVAENVAYGRPGEPPEAIATAIRAAGLEEVLDRLPEGAASRLGEAGGLVSGGEGQRIRLARALLRKDVRLAVLDEPFRGLDPARRSSLLGTVRQHWRNATLVFVTHDLADTVGFDRVLVVDGGRVIEDGSPAALLIRPGSHYRAAIDAAEAVSAGLHAGGPWRRLKVESGRLEEEVPAR